MDLTVGPNPFFWEAASIRAFYEALAAAPVARVILGEWVCSKRLPFWQDEISGAVETLRAAGKEVALTTLALITLARERQLTRDLFAMNVPIEVNDLSALRHVPEDTPFWVGPMVNVYNEGTLEWLARRGARRICLPPELPLTSVGVLARAGHRAGVAVEVWGHGRVPLAISGRCYHARLQNRAKDSCQFVCGEDPDGREIDTLDRQPFLTVNGVQTLSRSTASAVHYVPALRAAGVTSLRLSPATGNFPVLCTAYAEFLDGRTTAEDIVSRLVVLTPNVRLSNGFLAGLAGAADHSP